MNYIEYNENYSKLQIANANMYKAGTEASNCRLNIMKVKYCDRCNKVKICNILIEYSRSFAESKRLSKHVYK